MDKETALNNLVEFAKCGLNHNGRDKSLAEQWAKTIKEGNLVENQVSQPSEPSCEWKVEKRSIAEYDGLHDGYKTNCGYTISDSYIISAPHYKYCPFCGKLIHEQS
jgi:hypothetical protein